MGSFNETCALSGFSIPYGTPIRHVFLTQNPYLTSDQHETKKGVYHYDYWFVRTPPLKGRYDDYGQAVHDDPEMCRLIADVFSEDVVERPIGPNQYRDPAVRRGENLEHYLEAAWEGRLLVANQARTSRSSPESLPTMAVMIREDVWRAYLDLIPVGTLDDDVLKYYDRVERAKLKDEIYTRLLGHANFVCALPYQTSIATHLKRAAVSDYANKEELITACVEICRVESAMARLNRPWIVPITGGQDCHWDLQSKLTQSLACVAKKCFRTELDED